MASFPWTTLKRQELLQVQLQDLGVDWRGTYVSPLVQKLQRELDGKGIHLKPLIWVSDEWFCPDGINGFAVPFYLLHPKLMKLERDMIGRVEGELTEECMKLLRHEVGHVIDNAFGLRRSKKRQALFGLSSQPYPKAYRPSFDPGDFVNHLGEGYAESHPDEDWAETFAVWLDPSSQWQQTYRGTKAFEKLCLVDQLMTTIAGKRPVYGHKQVIDPLSKDRRTIFSFYQSKQKQLGLGPYSKLLKIFQLDKPAAGDVMLSKLLCQKRNALEKTLCRSFDLDQESGALAFKRLRLEAQIIGSGLQMNQKHLKNCILNASSPSAKRKVKTLIERVIM